MFSSHVDAEEDFDLDDNLIFLPFNSQGQHTDHSGVLLCAGGTCMLGIFLFPDP